MYVSAGSPEASDGSCASIGMLRAPNESGPYWYVAPVGIVSAQRPNQVVDRVLRARGQLRVGRLFGSRYERVRARVARAVVDEAGVVGWPHHLSFEACA